MFSFRTRRLIAGLMIMATVLATCGWDLKIADQAGIDFKDVAGEDL